ncbi:MAG: hypothetical protein MUF31_16430 [Akkermansiaceae bacterium]|nr:hypothetical protein [Akkermansiaceae bacterium]
MKALILPALFALAVLPEASAQTSSYTNFIRQTILGTTPAVYWDASVASSGERLSPSALTIAGARYELWTVKSGTTPTSYLLDTAFVSAYSPTASVTIRTEDTRWTGAVPRTRADRPFSVDITVNGLLSGPTDPAASKSVRLLRHGQSYGTTNGENIDRSQATLLSQAIIDKNGKTTLDYAITSISGADRLKVRGEERFSVFTRNDDGSDDQQLVSRYLQIWPVASASISGVTAGQTIRFEAPKITISVNDLYPSSYTYTQIYKGPATLGKEGKVVSSAQLQIDQATPESRVWVSEDYDDLIDDDGQWTIEVITQTVFGTERLAHVTFNVNRTLRVNSMMSSSSGS